MLRPLLPETKASTIEIKESKPVFAPTELNYVEGRNAYSGVGSGRNLAVKDRVRKQFFTKHSLVEKILRSKPLNPLIEEGKYINQRNRDHNGEYFLTHVAVDILVRQEILHRNNPAYNTENIFVINDNEQQLLQVIRQLNLKPGQDAKFIYIIGIHGVPFYIRNEAGVISCFIVDSMVNIDENCLPIIDILKKSFTNPFIVVSKTKLQRDWYSCTTFSIKALRFFAKHGADVFSHIRKYGTESAIKIDEIKDERIEYNELKAEHLMPTLLKWCQNAVGMPIPPKSFDEIVSHKKDLTLREYLFQVTHHIDSKNFNTAALNARYKLFHKLNETLASANKFILLLTQFGFDQKQWLELCWTLYQHGCNHLPDIFSNQEVLALLGKNIFDLFTFKDKQGNNFFHIAAVRGQVAAFTFPKQLGLTDEETRILLKTLNKENHTPLHLVVLNGTPETRKNLMDFYRKYFSAAELNELLFGKNNCNKAFLTECETLLLKAASSHDFATLHFLLMNKFAIRKWPEAFLAATNVKSTPTAIPTIELIWKICTIQLSFDEQFTLLVKKLNPPAKMQNVLRRFYSLKKLQIEVNQATQEQKLFSPRKALYSVTRELKLKQIFKNFPDMPFKLDMNNNLEIQQPIIDATQRLIDNVLPPISPTKTTGNSKRL